MKQFFIITFLLLMTSCLYGLDDGSEEVEYSIGQVNVFNSYEHANNESFIHLSHNYLYYTGFLYISFKSQLGVSRNLIFQNSTDLSYKNIITGVVPGVKYRYLDGFGNFIPEVSLGLPLEVMSLWEDSDENNLIFFYGLSLGTGISYDFREGLRLGFKVIYDFGYGNFMNQKRERFLSHVLNFILSFEFYE